MAIRLKLSELGETQPRDVREYIHRCGTLIWVATLPNELIGYQNDYGHGITQCPTCKWFIEWEDLQVPENVQTLGWPDD